MNIKNLKAIRLNFGHTKEYKKYKKNILKNIDKTINKGIYFLESKLMILKKFY